MLGPTLCQIYIPTACPQSELGIFKALKSDVQIRPVFADPVFCDY